MSEWYPCTKTLQVVPRPPECIQYIGVSSAAMGPGYLHCRLYHTIFLPVPEGWGHSEYRKEGDHAKLNNAVAQSPHYDLVNGWLYKHSDRLGAPLTEWSAAWVALFLSSLLSRLGSNHSNRECNSVKHRGNYSEQTWCCPFREIQEVQLD